MKTSRIALIVSFLFCSLGLFAQTSDLTKGCFPLEVNFTPPAGSSTYLWDFGNGQSSSFATPSTTYSSPGVYTVTFKETTGGAVIGTFDITVYPKPIIDIVGDPTSGCRPLAVAFSPNVQVEGDIVVSAYEWTYGDGSPAGTGATSSHTYTTSGVFTTSLEIMTNYPTCDFTEVFPDYIRVSNSPQVAISTSPNPPISCTPPLTVDFGVAASGGQAPLSFAWNFANGNTSTQQVPPAQTYTADGNYAVTLVVTDANGCSTTATRAVNVGKPTINIDLADTVCIDELITINNLSTPGANVWNFGPNATPMTSTMAKPQVAFSASGNQTVTLTVTASGGCSSTETFTVYVDQADASFTVTPAYSCSDPTPLTFNATANNSVSWLWSFNNLTSDTIRNPSWVWTNPDTTGYGPSGQIFNMDTLYVETAAGCKDFKIVTSEIWLPNAKFIPDVQHGCAPLDVVFMDESISNENIVSWEYLWDDGTTNTIVTSSQNVPHTFVNPGEYNVTLVIRNAAGCIDTSYAILIEVGAPLTGDFTVDVTEVCPGDTVQFTTLTMDPNIDAWHFSSESDRLWHCFNDPNPIWVYNSETGPMDVSLTLEYNGCFNTVTKDDLINVKGPIAKAHHKTTCDNTLEFEFTNMSSGADSVKWYYEGDSTTLFDFTHIFTTTGPKTIVLEATNLTSGCPASYDTFTVYPTQLASVFELEDTICGGTPLVLDGSMSIDVNATCYKGYTWYFDWDRPIRTDSTMVTVSVPLSGMYNIALEVEDINGCKDTVDYDFIAVELTPNFVFDKDTICNPSTVQFTDQTYAEIGIDAWEWDFGDGSTSTEQNPMHTFTTPPGSGFYTVSLKVTDKFGCPQSISHVIEWYAPQSTISSVPVPPICIGESLVLTASDFTTFGSNLEWIWEYNGVEQMGQSATYTFNTSGVQTVNLDFVEIATGCPGSSIFSFEVQDYPIASLELDETGTICAPGNITFTNTSLTGSPLTTTWDLGNGVTTNGNVVSGAYVKGNYTVKMLTQTSAGCADSTTTSFEVVGPEGDFNISDLIVCLGDEVTFTASGFIDVDSYSWTFGDGTTIDNQNPVTHAFLEEAPNDQRIVQLVLTSGVCSLAIDKVINFSPIHADFVTEAQTVCVGNPHVFINTSTAADEALWTFGDGTTSTVVGNQPHDYLAAGTYDVTLIVTDQPLGCMDTLTKTILVSDRLEVIAYGDTICPGDVATIGVSNASNDLMYIWTPSVLPPAAAPVVNVQPAQTTDYNVVVSDDFGCTGTATVNVFVPAGIEGIMSYDTLLGKNEPWTILTPNDFYNYQWEKTGPPVILNVTQTDTFNLTVTDLLGCFEEEYTFRVLLVPTDARAPNAFTPDGDGSNDQFKVLVVCGDDDFTQNQVTVEYFKIFNRWGNLVYESAGGTVLNTAWDGTQDGKLAPMDTYIYDIMVSFPNGTSQPLTGDVTLIR